MMLSRGSCRIFITSRTVFSWTLPSFTYRGLTFLLMFSQAASSHSLAASKPHLVLTWSYHIPLRVIQAYCQTPIIFSRNSLDRSSKVRLGFQGPLRSSSSFFPFDLISFSSSATRSGRCFLSSSRVSFSNAIVRHSSPRMRPPGALCPVLPQSEARPPPGLHRLRSHSQSTSSCSFRGGSRSGVTLISGLTRYRSMMGMPPS